MGKVWTYLIKTTIQHIQRTIKTQEEENIKKWAKRPQQKCQRIYIYTDGKLVSDETDHV